MYPPNKLPYMCAFWVAGATMGPAIGPILSGFAVAAKGWRWASWILLWIGGPVLLMLFVSLPETSHANILLRRAHRLRKITGRTDLKSQSEIDQQHMTAREVASDALIKPWEINALDPAVLFTTVYTSLVYGIFYSFFESFPLVYPKDYGFNLGETGLPFLGVMVGLIVALPLYCGYFFWHAEPLMLSQPGFGPPESRLVPGIFAAFIMPIGLFLFGKYPDILEANIYANGFPSLDHPSISALDGKHRRRCAEPSRLIHHHPVHVPLPPIHLSEVLRFSLCSKRHGSSWICRRRRYVLKAYVHQSRC